MLALVFVLSTVLTGVVTDGDGVPMPYATVRVAGTSEGAATDGQGAFAFRTAAVGSAVVEAQFLGYAPARRRVALDADTVRVDLVLREALTSLGRAVVSADAFTSGAEVRGLDALDVVTTPGAAADLFGAIATFPGVVSVDKGAGLFVRGGDVAETAVLLDGARLLRPYQFESPQGGARSSVSPWLVRGTRFSTGAFSARYGDALSGVLALDSQDEPATPSQTVDLGLAGASLGADVPVGTGGVRLAATQTLTDALFAVNGRGDAFETAPRATAGSVVASWPVADGRVKAVVQARRDALAVRVEEPSFSGVYESAARDGLALVEWTRARGRWASGTTLSVARRDGEQTLGALRLRPETGRAAVRAWAEHEASDRLRLHVGAEGSLRRARERAAIPPGDLFDPSAVPVEIDQTVRGRHVGGWAEAEAQLSRRVVVVGGLRGDAHSALAGATLDPRASVLVALDADTQLRLAGGRYSQAPALSTVARWRADGDAPREATRDALRAQRADHLVAGVLRRRGRLTLRAEAYAKRYRALAVERSGVVYGSVGTGWARGLDLFARWGDVASDRVSGWTSVSWLDARRTGVRRDASPDGTPTTRLDTGRPSFGVALSADAVGKVRVGRVTAALRGRLAAGRPVTAVERAVPSADGDFFVPVDGPLGGDTLAPFARLDASLSYTLPVARGAGLVLYGAVDNLLDRANAAGYAYSADYAERTVDASPFRRSLYVGATLVLSR